MLRFPIRDGAAAQLLPKGAGIVVARRGKKEGVAWGTQIFLEQIVSQRSSLWLDEKTTRTQAEKPTVCGEEGGREREGESSNDARGIAHAIAVLRAVCHNRILNQ